MAAPTVTRPSASVVPDSKPGQASPSSINWAQYTRWILLGAVVLGAIGIVYSVVTAYSESSRHKALTSQWDELHGKLDKIKNEDARIEAYEQACDDPKIKGTAVHGFALMQLASMHFELAQSPRKQPESRAAALGRAIKIYEMVSSTEPFKSHPSFGPVALSNLATAYEQQAFTEEKGIDFYDKAIDTLQSGLYADKSKEAEAIPAMKTHFLFDKMNAQLGRLYWLRGVRKVDLARAAGEKEKPAADKAATDKPAADKTAADKAAADKAAADKAAADKQKEADDAKYEEAGTADRALALFYIKHALDLGVPTTEKERFERMSEEQRYYGQAGNLKASWREQATYLKALLEPAGRMLKNGVPPVKPEPPAAKADEKKDDAKDKAKTGDTKAPETKEGEKKESEKKDEKAADKKDEKKDAPKADPAKKEEPKKDEKKDDAKKTGSVEPDNNNDLADDPSAPRQHLTYAQIQTLLKQGRPALCQCPRCANTDKAIGAKLAE